MDPGDWHAHAFKPTIITAFHSVTEVAVIKSIGEGQTANAINSTPMMGRAGCGKTHHTIVAAVEAGDCQSALVP